MNNKLVIPISRKSAANWVFQFSILTSLFSITQVPYNASIIAHENMNVYAYVEILRTIFKLLIISLLKLISFDKLILYSFLMFFSNFIILFIYRIFCIKNYPECHFKFIWDKTYLLPLLSFSGWNLFGNFGGIMGNHGNNLIINSFFGVTMNAASGIALNVSGIVNQFATNAMTAFRPPIIKLYANGNTKYMQELTIMALVIISYLYLLIAIPVFIKCDYLLSLWLVDVPQYSSLFCKIVLISIIFETLRYVIIINIHASGNVKIVSALSGSLFCLSPVILYFFYKNGYSVQYSFVIILIINFILLLLNIMIAKYYIIMLEVKLYYITIIRIITCGATSLFLILKVNNFLKENFVSLIIICIFSTIILSLIFCFGGLSSIQRELVFNYIKKYKYKYQK